MAGDTSARFNAREGLVTFPTVPTALKEVYSNGTVSMPARAW